MTTFLRYLKVISFIILVAALSMMPACGSEEPVDEQPSDLSSSYIEQPLDYVGPCDVLHYTFHIVNTGSPTDVRVVCNFSNHIAIREESIFVTGNAGDCLVDYDREDQVATITLAEGNLLSSEIELLISADGTAFDPPLGEPILTECLIYDILEEKEYKLEDTVDFHPGIEYGWNEAGTHVDSMYRDECDVMECLPSSQEKTDFDKAGVPTGRSITQYECDSLGRRIIEERTDFDEQGALLGGATTIFGYGAGGNVTSEETTNRDKHGTPTGSTVTSLALDNLKRLAQVSTLTRDEEGTLTGNTTTEYVYDDMEWDFVLNTTYYFPDPNEFGSGVSGSWLTKCACKPFDVHVPAGVLHPCQGPRGFWIECTGVIRYEKTNFDSTGAKTSSTVTDYEYDDLGRRTQLSVRNLDELDEQIDRTLIEYGHDSSGRRTEVSVSNFDENDAQTKLTVTKYKYNAFDMITEVSVSNFDENLNQTDGTLTTYEHDLQGRVNKVSTSYLDENDKQTCATSIHYDYDDKGRIIKVTISTFDGNNTLTQKKVTEYTYNEEGEMTEVSSEISDPIDDLYGSGGVPATGPDWQDITSIKVTSDGETIELSLTFDDIFPGIEALEYGAIMFLLDTNGDAHVEPAEGPIDIYGGNFDFGVFIPWPGFGEPAIFIEDLRLEGGGQYDTEGAQYSVDGNTFKSIITVGGIEDADRIGYFGGIKTGINSDSREDSVACGPTADCRVKPDLIGQLDLPKR